jgi:hypothetical protein
MEDERALADSLDDLLAQLTDLDDRTLDEVFAEGWQGLDGLYAAVRNLSY